MENLEKEMYCLGKKGEIRIFIIKADIINSQIITATGIVKGKLIEKQVFIRKAKQGRNIQEQLLLEYNSLINEKYNEGYKTIEDFKAKCKTIECFSSDINGLIKELSITYNSNKDWLPLPMLAMPYNKVANKTYPAFIQPKLNGVRCLASYNYITDKVILMSRGGIYYNVPTISNQLYNILKQNPHIVLDGELYIHNEPLQNIVGLARTEIVSSLFPENSRLEYHIYDLINLEVLKQKQKDRFELLTDLLANEIDLNPSLKFVKTIIITNPEEAKIVHDNFVKSGYEGAILRNPDGIYEISFRSNYLIKMKEFQDTEFEIIGCEIEDNNPESFVFILKNDINDLTFKARPTGSLQEKQNWNINISKYLGKMATVRYQERAESGLPIQGHVRHKNTTCLIEIIRDYE